MFSEFGMERQTNDPCTTEKEYLSLASLKHSKNNLIVSLKKDSTFNFNVCLWILNLHLRLADACQ